MITRDVENRDWQKISWLASGEVQEGDHTNNNDWVERRQSKDERYQAVIEYEDEVVGYCAIERLPTDKDFRAFIVMDWKARNLTVAEMAYSRLEEMINEHQLDRVWMREMAGDTSLLSFIQQHGFKIEKQYEVEGYNIVNLAKRFGA